jgi:hypothetical protein
MSTAVYNTVPNEVYSGVHTRWPQLLSFIKVLGPPLNHGGKKSAGLRRKELVQSAIMEYWVPGLEET